MATVDQSGGGEASQPAGNDEAARIAERAREIYGQIVSRAPEHKVSPTIDRVAELIDLLGSPQHSYRAIHITGTNGKTSTSRMIERLLREMGLRTGRFTSPHLHTVRERIAIDGEPISPEQFVATWEEISPLVEIVDARLEEHGQGRLNFFEVLTAMAYAAFADAPIDVAVVEELIGVDAPLGAQLRGILSPDRDRRSGLRGELCGRSRVVPVGVRGHDASDVRGILRFRDCGARGIRRTIGEESVDGGRIVSGIDQQLLARSAIGQQIDRVVHRRDEAPSHGEHRIIDEQA